MSQCGDSSGADNQSMYLYAGVDDGNAQSKRELNASTSGEYPVCCVRFDIIHTPIKSTDTMPLGRPWSEVHSYEATYIKLLMPYGHLA